MMMRIAADVASTGKRIYQVVSRQVKSCNCQLILTLALAGTFSVTVTLDCQGQALQAELAAGEWQALAAGPGDTLYVALPPEKIFLMPVPAASSLLFVG